MSTAQERLQQGYYNSAAISGANPGGLANGGHVQNFPAALADVGTVAQTVSQQASGVAASAQTASEKAAAASQDRIAAQQAAQAAATSAGQINPATYVQRVGDTMTGPLRMPELRLKAAGTGSGSTYATVFSKYYGDDNYGIAFSGWRGGIGSEEVASIDHLGRMLIKGQAPITLANDGSGSGLDADLVRGQAPSVGAAANTLVTRNGDGSSGFKAVYLASAGQVFFEGLAAGFYEYDAGTLGFGKAIYVGQGVSASELRQRSDRRLKRNIQALEAGGRLAPVRFVLKDSGEEHIGFIAQDVAEVRREAVRVGGGEGELPMLEVSPMALIAHLAAQVNALQDRLDAAGL